MSQSETESKTRRGQRAKPTIEDVQQAFVACPRCSYFLTGYRLNHDDLDAAIQATDGKWLALSWSQAIHELILKSYGRNINSDHAQFSGVCPDCWRIYIYQAAATRQRIPQLRIKIMPG